MTIFSKNSIFSPILKYFKFYNSEIDVIDAVNRVNCLPLNDIKIDYNQFLRTSVEIPKGQTDFVLSFPMMGIKQTFLCIKPVYDGLIPKNNYLKWKFQSSSDTKYSFTNILILTGTAANPITSILIDNPNMDCTVQLEILSGAIQSDYLNDTAAFIYLDGLTYDKVHTYNETNSQILSFFNKDGVLAGTLDFSNISNFYSVPDKNRIIVVENGDKNIVLDFVSDMQQALSAINWVLLDPLTRFLPQAKDTTKPVVTFKPAIVADTLTFSLATYPLGFTKLDFITAAVLTVVDDRDGSMIAVPNNIVLKDSATFVIVPTIVAVGSYIAEITISDLAGNAYTHTINITVTT